MTLTVVIEISTTFYIASFNMYVYQLSLASTGVSIAEVANRQG